LPKGGWGDFWENLTFSPLLLSFAVHYKNNTVRVLPIKDTLYRTVMDMPEKSGYVFGNGKPS